MSIRRKVESTEIAKLEILLRFSELVLLCQRSALVVELFTFGKADLHLDEASLEIDAQRHDRVALFGSASREPVDLGAVQQKFPRAERILVENIALFVRTDVHAVDDDLPAVCPDKGLFDGALAHAQGLHLGAGQLNAGFVGVLDKVIVVCFFVVCDQLDRFFVHGRPSLLDKDALMGNDNDGKTLVTEMLRR